MNINRLLHIAQQADIEGDYVTADRVTNLLKTAQGQYSVMPSNTTQQPSNQSNRQVSPQEYVSIRTQYSQELSKSKDPNKNTLLLENIKKDSRLSPQQRQQLLQESQTYLQQLKNNPALTNPSQNQANNAVQSQPPIQQQMGMPQMQPMQAMGMPEIQPMQQTGQTVDNVYYAPLAPGATWYTPGVVNVAPQKMTPEQKAVADLRGLRAQAVGGFSYQQQKQPYPIYQTHQQPVYQGTNTQDQYNFNPNAPTNMNLYGTGYASRAMQPQ